MPPRMPDDLPKIPADAIPDGYVPQPAHEAPQAKKGDTPRARIEVCVAHGNLGFASHPVALGHYDGDLIVSAEAELDRLLDYVLTMQHATGSYPGPLKTATVVFNKYKDRSPKGALIVGLGRAGRLTPGTLTASLARGFVEYANVCMGRPRDMAETTGEENGLSLSCLLIGSGEGGLSMRESLQCLLDGVLEANRSLASVPGKDDCLEFRTIEIIELFEDIANEAIEVLIDLAKGSRDFAVTPELRERPGGLRRIMRRSVDSWWRRLQITGTPATKSRGMERDDEFWSEDATRDGQYSSLRFLALTDRARIPRYVVHSQVALVEQLVRESLTRTAHDPDLSRALFEMLVPPELKHSVSEGRSLELVLDEHSAVYPWELLEDPRGRFPSRSSDDEDTGDEPRPKTQPISVQFGIVRRLIDESPNRNIEEARADKALVVGNPRIDHPNFPDLPGAAREAIGVTQFLSGPEANFQVVSAINRNQKSVVKAVFGHPDGRDGYRILHLAGHGVHSPDGKSGMLVGPNAVLGANEIEAMPTVPEFVFLNCCHLGRMDGVSSTMQNRDANRLAANLGVAFIQRGAHAVIAAGWAVNDLAATEFATEVYRELLVNHAFFGDAVKLARRKIFNRYPESNTWGAYQCYGDHSYRMRASRPTSNANSKRKRRWWRSSRTLIQDLENLSRRADTTRDEVDKLCAELTALHRELVEHEVAETEVGKWYAKDAAVRSHLASTYFQLGMFKEAKEHFQTAFTLEGSSLPVRHIEIYANLKARHAFGEWMLATEICPQRGSGAEKKKFQEIRETALKQLGEAVDDLDKLARWGETTERWNLRGSALKRLAAMSDQMDRRLDELFRAASAYAAGLDKSWIEKKEWPKATWRQRKDLAYSAYNVALCVLMLEELGRKSPKLASNHYRDLKSLIATGSDLADFQEKTSPDFFSRINVAEFGILKELGKPKGPTKKSFEQATAHYEAAWRRGGSVRSILSTIENLRCAREILTPATPKVSGARKAILEFAEQMEDFLEELYQSSGSQAKSDGGEG